MYEVYIGVSRSNSKSQVEVKSEVDVDWRRDWISSLYLSVQSGSVELQEEYLVYDFQVDNSFKLFVDIKSLTWISHAEDIFKHNGRISSAIWGATWDFSWAGKISFKELFCVILFVIQKMNNYIFLKVVLFTAD